MQTLFADRVLTADGWRNSVRLQLRAGRVATLQTQVPAEPGDERHAVIVPALGNLHSHAFQRGMAGLAEIAGDAADSFWSWREVMYRFALRMTPDQLEAIAAQAYVEMLETGFGRVGEFHYLHHDADGAHYADVGEMAGRIAAAAETTGMELCLLPVFYAHSSFGGAAPGKAQRRFINSLDSYQRLLERCRQLPASTVGVAPHSLRAVTKDELLAVADMARSAPIHIHIAEQTKEVAECVAWSGQRPVAWLLDNAPVDERWCLVHATHVDAQEIAGIAEAKAVVGLCPVTEANLGDGVFPLPELLSHGGRLGVGTDSNVHIGVAAELSLLEYSQRLTQRARNVAKRGQQSTGRAIMELTLAGGAQALGGAGRIEQGAAADFVSLDSQHPALYSRDRDALLDAWIFASAGNLVDCVWIAGRKVVEAGRHLARDPIRARFRTVMKDLCS
ncbi:formimidoylglutamate deiminase [Peristeroidobacter soli]|uniref:formimidoylglutamate deiminase n=1 Tax=Peristeroidobacter soli TaxID=2497877 RepID=UPI00101BC8A2|nr:formimidoylglutamate deiminase [Peristeroidobacter soli]